MSMAKTEKKPSPNDSRVAKLAIKKASLTIEEVQRIRGKFSRTDVAIINQDRKAARRYSPYISSPLNPNSRIREVSGKISRAYWHKSRRPPLKNTNVKLLKMALFHAKHSY
ncbi:7441_t:CDS:2 [Diversispora eburnea]|uniref:7441_t:CDS:1 n=1 Tax=Diversispora eburnea TaxID=1213867 RepID=A0A9N9BYB5_9GLOM|nr:7441_t:CDS:2 [Diversispora eburnea]